MKMRGFVVVADSSYRHSAEKGDDFVAGDGDDQIQALSQSQQIGGCEDDGEIWCYTAAGHCLIKNWFYHGAIRLRGGRS